MNDEGAVLVAATLLEESKRGIGLKVWDRWEFRSAVDGDG